MRTDRVRLLPVLLVAMGSLTSCKLIHEGGLEPVSPRFSSNHVAIKADSLQPTLVWKAPSGTREIFDVIIFSGVETENGGRFYVPRKQLYIREGVSGTSHKVETPLPPETVCVWAVRVRDGGTTGPWSRRRGGSGFVKDERDHQWWLFQTPKQ
jgi:hypothetical protein